eukprot:UN17249
MTEITRMNGGGINHLDEETILVLKIDDIVLPKTLETGNHAKLGAKTTVKYNIQPNAKINVLPNQKAPLSKTYYR